jgi:hypothetical protein
MEVAAAVAPQDFELAVDGLDDVGGGERAADGVGIVEKGDVMTPFLRISRTRWEIFPELRANLLIISALACSSDSKPSDIRSGDALM